MAPFEQQGACRGSRLSDRFLSEDASVGLDAMRVLIEVIGAHCP